MIFELKKNQVSSDEEENSIQKDLQSQKKFENINLKSNRIKKSSYIDEYTINLVRGRKIKSTTDFSKNFIFYGINYMNEVIKPLPLELQMLTQSRNYRIVHYQVKLSHFCLKIKILNISTEDNLSFRCQNEIDRGMFGTVYEVRENGKSFAVKEIRLDSNPIFTIEMAVKEYALMKLLAALQCGPRLNKLYGFDLLVTDNFIYFESEKCLSIEEYLLSIEDQSEFESAFEELQLSLLHMHSLNICHNDIKPCNIMFSPSLKKLIFIDFGLSEVKPQKLGYMKEETQKGSFYYCCEDMKKLFISSKIIGYVDTYYNDFFGLMKSKETIISMISTNKLMFNKKQSLSSEFDHQFYCNQGDVLGILENIMNGEGDEKYIEQFQKNINVFKIFQRQWDNFTVLVCFILSECRISDIKSMISENQEIKKKLQVELFKYYWVFLEMKVNISVETTYKKLRAILLENPEISYQTKTILENILDPYFSISQIEELQTNQSYLNYMKQQQTNRKIFTQRFKITKTQTYRFSFTNFSKKEAQKSAHQFQLSLHFQHLESLSSLEDHEVLNFSQLSRNVQERLQNFQIKHKIKLTSFNELKRQQVIAHFLRLKDTTFHKLFDNIHNKLVLKSSLPQIFQLNVQVLIKIFYEGGVEIDTDELYFKDKKTLQKEQFVICLNLLTDIILEFLKKFDIGILIVALIQKITTKGNEIIEKLKDKQLSQKKDGMCSEEYLKQQHNVVNLNHNKCQYQVYKNFTMCLVIFLKISQSFTMLNPYGFSQNKIDILIQNMTLKAIQLIEYHQQLQKTIKEHHLCSVLNELFQELMVFIYEVGINSIIKAQIHDDYQRFTFYYREIFNFNKYFKKAPQKQHFVNIIKLHQIFYFTKDLCSMLIYNSVIPLSLFEKYQIVEKAQHFIQIVNLNQFQTKIQHIKALKNKFFWYHFTLLKNQTHFSKLLQKIDQMIIQNQQLWDKSIVEAFLNVYKLVNNNRKIKQMQRKILIYFGDSFDKLKSRNEKIKQEQVQKDQFQANIDIGYQKQSEQFSQQKFVNESEKIFDQINYFLDLEQYEISLKVKLYHIRKLITNSLSSFPKKDLHLQYYVEKYFQQLQKHDVNSQRKILLLKDLPLDVPVFHFLTKRVVIKKNNMFFEKLLEMSQNQFWWEIYREEIMDQYSCFILTLLAKHYLIKNKNIIFNAWEKFNHKIKSLFQGKQKQSLTYLKLYCRLKQLIYSETLKQNAGKSENQHKIDSSLQQFFTSIEMYLNEFNPFNHQFLYNLKIPKYYMDSLIKIYKGALKIKGYPKLYAKSKLIELFYFLIEINQSYIFFAENEIIEQFIDCIVDFGVQKVKERMNDEKDLRTMEGSEKNKNDESSQEFILQTLFLEIGSFAQKYPCSNYSKTILTLATSLTKHIKQTFLKEKFISNSDFFNVLEVIMTKILKRILATIIIKNSLSQLILVYFFSLNFLAYEFKLVANATQCKFDQEPGRELFSNNCLNLFYYAFKKIFWFPFTKIQHCAKEYSKELINQILLKITLKQSPKYISVCRNYFRSFRNNQWDCNFEEITGMRSKKANNNNVGRQIFQKRIKKLLYNRIQIKCSQNYNKYFQSTCLQKLKSKMIERLVLSVATKP